MTTISSRPFYSSISIIILLPLAVFLTSVILMFVFGPRALVENRIDGMLRDLAYKMASQGMDPSKANVDWMKVRTDFRSDAEKQVKANLMLGEIGRRENIEISSETLEQEMAQMADTMEQPTEKVQQYFQQEGRMEGLETQLIQKKAVKILVDGAEITDG